MEFFWRKNMINLKSFLLYSALGGFILMFTIFNFPGLTEYYSFIEENDT